MNPGDENRARVDVLIAEDDGITRLTLRNLLENEGYCCAEAEDGQEAIEFTRQCRPRLLLLDVMMPVVDGFNVARRIRSQTKTRRTPIVFLTARDDDAAWQAARRFRKQTLLTKPVDYDGLLDVISVVMGQGKPQFRPVDLGARRG